LPPKSPTKDKFVTRDYDYYYSTKSSTKEKLMEKELL
jgi:hypothetical protein